MKKLRKFEEEQSYWDGTFIYPTVVYAVDSDTVFFEKESYILSTYNVSSTTSPTVLLGTNFDMNQVSKMYIGEDEIEPTKQYTFNQTGTYTVKTVFKYLNSFYGLFESAKQLIDVNLNNIDTRKVRNTAYMFYSASNLTSLDLSMLNTSNVENMLSMFDSCSNLENLNVSKFNTSNVENMKRMFYNCSKLSNLNVSSFDTSKVKNMDGMFKSINTELKLINFNTSNVIDMANMFYCYEGSTVLDISNFDTSNVENMTAMFSDCIKLTNIIFGEKWDTSKVISFRRMFYTWGNPNLLEIDMSKWNVNNLEDAFCMFSGQQKLNKIIFGENWKHNKINNFSNMFQDCYALTSIDIENLSVKFATDVSSMFLNCRSLTILDLSNWTENNIIGASSLFNKCFKLESIIGIENINTSNVTYMSNMFYNCQALTSLDLSKWNINNVVSLDGMFYSCNNLTSLDLRNWNTSNVETIGGMFGYCSKLSKINGIENFNVDKVYSFNNLFINCSELTSLDLSQWNIGNNVSHDIAGIFYCAYMFKNCSKLTKILGIEKFNVKNSNTLTEMFYNCSELTSLDLSQWDLNNIESINGAFYGCKKLTDLKLPINLKDYINYSTSIFQGLSENGTITYNKAYDYSKLLDKSLTSFPSSWNINALDSVVNIRVRIVSDSNEIKEGTVIVNNTNGIYNSEKDYWEFTYNASTYEYDILLNGEIIGKVNHSDKIQYIFIGENNWDYERFNIIEKINVTSTTKEYEFIGYDFYKRIIALFVDGKQININYSNYYTFDEIGEHTVKIIFNCEDLLSTKYLYDWYDYIIELTLTKEFDTSKVVSMASMFEGLENCKKINLENFNTSNVINLDRFIGWCEKLENIDNIIDTLDTSNVKTMYCTFAGLLTLETIDLSNLNVTNLTHINSMLDGCENLKSVTFGNNFRNSKIIDVNNLFYNCSSLTTINGIDNFVEEIDNISWMFANCNSLKTIDLSVLKISPISQTFDTFYKCESLENVIMPKINKIKRGENTFYLCPNLNNIELNITEIVLTDSCYPFFKNLNTYGTLFINCNKYTELLVQELPPTWEIKFVE